MQIVENETFVRSRVKIGNMSHFVSLGLLVVGFVLSLLGPTIGSEAIYAAYAAMIAALLLLNFGRGYTRRWAPRFRQDGLIAGALRGLDNQYTLLSFASKELPDHILVGPTGLFVFVPRAQGGKIGFDGQRWSRGSLAGTILRNLGEGGLGNPIADMQRALGQLAAYLQKNAPAELIQGLEGRPVIVFTNPGVQLEVRNAQMPVMKAKDLKSLFRKAKANLPQERVEGLRKVLVQETGK